MEHRIDQSAEKRVVVLQPVNFILYIITIVIGFSINGKNNIKELSNSIHSDVHGVECIDAGLISKSYFWFENGVIYLKFEDFSGYFCNSLVTLEIFKSLFFWFNIFNLIFERIEIIRAHYDITRLVSSID